jgi:murein DD-endopeptidase / murein LD-carboxypeptidase
MRKRRLNTDLLAVLIFLILAGCAGTKPDPRYNRDRDKAPTSDQSKSTRDGGYSPRYPDNLDSTIESWWGTPYRWGGSKKGVGVDCSAYVQQVYDNVYGLPLPRTTAQQFKQGWPVDKKDIRRGDLVFFNTSGKGVSHVGIYLGGGNFTHAASSDGVTINKLSESYYAKRYLGARRVR